MDSLRYWLTEMHVDGFRFDLAPTLARQDGEFGPRSAFFDLVAQDPVVSRAKLIAEPWDVGQIDSYDLGGFPPGWREWNGKYRDCMRDFWRSHQVGIGEFATRLCGSADLYGRARRRPTASVNLITVHDGFTLRDLVSYNDKHNEANGEANRDGTDDNRSWNCGAEGATDDPAVLTLRARQSRAMLTTLLLSFGVPMLLGGDEIGRTQQGNNNAYCQDNEITWFDWSAPDQDLLASPRDWSPSDKSHPVFRRRRFLAWCRGVRALVVYAGRHSDDRRRLVRSARSGDRSVPRRIRRPGPGRRRLAHGGRRLSRARQCLVGTAFIHHSDDASGHHVATGDRQLCPHSQRRCRGGRPVGGRTSIDRGTSRPQLVILGFAGLGHSFVKIIGTLIRDPITSRCRCLRAVQR